MVPSPSFGPTVLPPLVAFVAAGLLSPLYSDSPFELGQLVWSAVVLWPIGLCLVGVPILVLLGARTARSLRLGQAAIGLLAVLSAIAAARSDDAQAGLWFVWPPLLGTILAVLLVATEIRRPKP